MRVWMATDTTGDVWAYVLDCPARIIDGLGDALDLMGIPRPPVGQGREMELSLLEVEQ